MTSHLTRDELQRWWDHGAPAERDRIVGHLAECDACGALYAEIVDAQPVTPAADPVDPVLVRRAYRAYRRPGRALAQILSWPQGLALAAAAVLLLAIAIPLSTQWTRVDQDADGIRGSTLQALAPIGAVAAPVRFEWASPVRAARYRVDIQDAQGTTVLRLSSRTERLELPPDALAQLEPGRRYTWQVTAFDAAGDEMMRAPAQGFLVSATPQ